MAVVTVELLSVSHALKLSVMLAEVFSLQPNNAYAESACVFLAAIVASMFFPTTHRHYMISPK